MKAKSIKQLLEKCFTHSQPIVIYASSGIIDKNEVAFVQDKTGMNVEGLQKRII
jgi:hypothetical protein